MFLGRATFLPYSSVLQMRTAYNNMCIYTYTCKHQFTHLCLHIQYNMLVGLRTYREVDVVEFKQEEHEVVVCFCDKELNTVEERTERAG